MSRLGNEWTDASGNIMRFQNEFLNEKVDKVRLPYSTQVDGLVYHSNIPRIRLSGRMIDLTKPLSPEDQAVLRQTMPKSRGEAVQQFQSEFEAKKQRESADARTRYFRETSQGKQEAFNIRYEQYLKEHPEMVAFQKIVDGLVKIGDELIPLGSAIGMPSFLIDIYKKFAPPGSKFYKKGQLEEKLLDFAKEKGEGYIKNVVKQEGTAMGKQLVQQLKNKI
jgi:hypothetical protein